MCMCVCMYVCMYVCCVFMYVCVYVRMYVCLYMCVKYVFYMYVCVCMYVCMCVCMNVCILYMVLFMYSRRQKKFRISFRRTAVARLKNGGITVRRLLKNGRSVRPRYRLIFLVHRMSRSKKYKKSFIQ